MSFKKYSEAALEFVSDISFLTDLFGQVGFNLNLVLYYKLYEVFVWTY